jgi:peptide/nickel transport system permease protein
MRAKRRTFPITFALNLASLTFVVLGGVFAASALVRFSPGFDIDENSWNPKISADTSKAMHALNEGQNRLPVFYFHYLRSALHGDLGKSESLKIPVTELLRQRAPVSGRLIGWGTAGGMLLGALFAWLAVWPRQKGVGFLTTSASALLLAIPPAVLALAFFFTQSPLWLAVALALLPRVFGTMRALLSEIYQSPALLAARARGVGPGTLAWRYAVLPALPQLAALTGVSLVLAFGSLVPIEALCDVPGIGQLAWKAALARDLPLLSGLALIVTSAVASVHALGELVS